MSELVSAKYLENELIEFDQICMYIGIDKIKDGIVTCHFSQVYNRVMAPGLYQNFVYAQYLENKLTAFCNFVTELWPLTDLRILFRLKFLIRN